MSIHKKLQAIQQALKAPKNQRNNFGNYNYRSCEDILEALKPLLKEHDCVLVMSDHIENIGDRYYIKAIVELVCAENDKENVVSYGFAREEESKKGMDGSQITGACSSYARKYALNGLFLIDDNKDSDATNTHDKEEKKDPMEAKAKEIALDDLDEHPVKCSKCKGKTKFKEIKAKSGKTYKGYECTEGCLNEKGFAHFDFE